MIDVGEKEVSEEVGMGAVERGKMPEGLSRRYRATGCG